MALKIDHARGKLGEAPKPPSHGKSLKVSSENAGVLSQGPGVQQSDELAEDRPDKTKRAERLITRSGRRSKPKTP
jgi:hypothetical protein